MCGAAEERRQGKRRGEYVRQDIKFALNHIMAPGLESRELIDLAARLGCGGVELRNDLADKGLTDRPYFDGGSPDAVGAYARSKGVQLLGLSESMASTAGRRR